MELSFKELKKREVINVTDGKSLGHITDLTLSFPIGTFIGITVPGKKQCFILNLFSKSETFIERSKIQKIGADVILVNLNCGEVCSQSVNANVKKQNPCNPFCQSTSSQGEIDISDY